jgi:peptide/nickel transport system permease protein
LALNLYAIETVFVGGVAKQVYPRLSYTSPMLRSEAEVQTLVGQLCFKAFFYALIFISVLSLLMLVGHRLRKGQWQLLPSKTFAAVLITVFLGLFAVLASYWISRHLHLLGTGKIGQDIFYYTLKSIRTGLVIGILTTLVMMPLALILGIAAGYFGGYIDDFIQYSYITLSSIPGVLLITASVLSMQTYIANHPEYFTTLAKSADARLFALCLILGVTSWTSLCRLLRAEALKLREIDYVLAARALGSSSFTILRKHLLPNVMHIVLITLVLDFSFLVLAEAVLSYVGVGVSPMTISWGNMINGARLELARDPLVWWPMLAAFSFMFLLVLSANLFADAVRDAFDPHHV